MEEDIGKIVDKVINMEWNFDASPLEEQYRQEALTFWKDIIPLGFLPVGLSLKSADIKQKEKICSKKEDE